MEIKIHYRNDEVRELYKNAGVQTAGSAGFDLVCCEDIKMLAGTNILIDLGVVIQIPEGYHALVMPRSSTFRKYGILQANSVGLIDNDYCGPGDYWRFSAYGERSALNLEDGFFSEIVIPKGTRIAQFVIHKTNVIDSVVEFEPSGESRGSFGSTGN